MASSQALRTAQVGVEYTEVPDLDGCPFFAPSTKVDCWRMRGLSSITVTFNLEPARSVRPWLTVSEAARLHMSDIDGLAFEAAQVKISRACNRGEITSEGRGTRRRIEPNSLDTYRLTERERNLSARD